MARAFLRPKAEVTLNNEPYWVERQCADGIWVLRHKHTDRPLEKSTAKLFDAYVVGELTFKNFPLHLISSGRPLERKKKTASFPEASSSEKNAAKLRLVYARAVVGLPFSQSKIEQAIENVWSSLTPRPARKPGWISVYRWARAYLASEETPAALLAANNARGNRESRFHTEVVELCRDVIESVYLTLERPGVGHVLNIAKAQVRSLNVTRPKSGQLAMPTRRLLQRLINEIPAFTRHAARYGRESARVKYRSVLRHRLTDVPLQRGEIDHMRMDLFVVDDVNCLPLGRPWLTIMVDDFTRCVLGFSLGFEPPSRASVAKCLRHAFMPKTGLRGEYPDLKNDWTAFGIPSELVMDNGVEFHSADLENICYELGIEQHFSPRKTAWFKGKVERLQGTLNRSVTFATPGKTFSSILEREDYDPLKHAVVTMSGLRHVVIRWIVDVYHQKRHSALGCSPAQMWESNIRLLRSLTVASVPVLTIKRGYGKGPQCFVSTDDWEKFEQATAAQSLLELGQAKAVPERIAPVVKLRDYLEYLNKTGDLLPRCGTRPNRVAIAKACGFYRDVFRRNPRA
ncbi:MAG: transposase, partial [Betaproteobacteria bacterium]|nr:transposase [Betaproteobacteria bacterium]